MPPEANFYARREVDQAERDQICGLSHRSAARARNQNRSKGWRAIREGKNHAAAEALGSLTSLPECWPDGPWITRLGSP